MSFYQGLVAKLVIKADIFGTWVVVGVENIDTNCDQNMTMTFSHATVERAAFVPVSLIDQFDPNNTKLVKRTFDSASGTEKWQALQ